MTQTLLPLNNRQLNIFWGRGRKEEQDLGSQWTILVFAAAELRCWRSGERTAGRDRQQQDAEPVSAVTKSLFTVTGDSDLGERYEARLMLILVLK